MKFSLPSIVCRPLLFLVATLLSVYSVQAATLDAQQAYKIARESFARLTGRAVTTSGPDLAPVLRLTHTQNTPDGTPAVYVFNNVGGGFILIAADDRPDPVLGYSSEGSFTIGKDYAPHKAFLANYALEMTPSSALQRRLDKRQRAPRRLPMTHDPLPANVAPLLGGIRWDQGYPFYLECPRYNNLPTVTGCVATAVAQIMRYWKHPAQGAGQEAYVTPTLQIPQEVNFAEHTYDWPAMLEYYGAGGVMERQRKAVSTFIHDVGVALKMDYTSTGSAARSEGIVEALTTHFGYDTGAQLLYGKYYSIPEWADILRRELADGRPLYLAGGPQNGVQHAFVCDGYETEGSFFHINWGWGGEANGLFKLTALVPSVQGIGAVANDYSANQTAVIGIQPDRGGLPHPVPSLLCYYSSLSFQQTSSTTSPSGLSLVLHGSVANYGSDDFEGALGIIATNNDTGQQSLMVLTENLSLIPGRIIWDYPAYIPDVWHVANLTFQYAVRPAGSEEWQLLRPAQGEVGSVSLRKKDGALTAFADSGNISMTATSRQLLTPHPHPGQPATVRFQVQNNAGRFDQPVKGEHKQSLQPPASFRLSVLKKNEEGKFSRVSVQAVSGLSLEEYQLTPLDITLKALPADTGTYYIALAHSDANGYYTMLQEDGTSHLALVEVRSAPATAPEPYLADLTLTTADSALIESTTATLSARIGNTGLGGDLSLRCTLTPNDSSALFPPAIASWTMSLSALEEEEATSPLTLPAAGLYTATLEYTLPDGTWQPLTYSDGTPVSLTLSILPAAEPDGIHSLPFTTSPFKGERGSLPPYDLQGRRQLSSFERGKPIFIHNGKKLIGKQ